MTRSYSICCAEEQNDLLRKDAYETLLDLCRSAELEEPSCHTDSADMTASLEAFLADRFQLPQRGRLAGGGLYGDYLRWCDAGRIPSERRLSELLFREEYGERSLQATDRANASGENRG
jgi:hypothetical protein